MKDSKSSTQPQQQSQFKSQQLRPQYQYKHQQYVNNSIHSDTETSIIESPLEDELIETILSVTSDLEEQTMIE